MIDTEPYLAGLLESRKARRQQPAYVPQNDAAVADMLEAYLSDKAPSARVSHVSRLGGGASKEQFAVAR